MRKVFILLLALVGQLLLFARTENTKLTQKLNVKYGYARFDSNLDDSYYLIGKYPFSDSGACDAEGNEIVPIGDYRVSAFYSISIHDAMKIEKNYKYGVFNVQHQKITIPIEYDDISPTKNERFKGYCLISKNGKYGIASVNGVVVNAEYDFIALDIELSNYIMVKQNDKYGVIHLTKGVILPPTYDYISTFYGDDGYLEVGMGQKRGVYDINNHQLVVPIEYDNISLYYNKWQTAEVSINGKIGLYSFDKHQLIIPIEYDDFYKIPNSENLPYVWAKKDGLMGYLDGITYQPVTEFIYESCSEFQNGIARVKRNGQWELLPDPQKIAMKQPAPSGKRKAVSTYPAPHSDVDDDIPFSKHKAENTFAYIIANENYEIAKVPYALNDGWIFEKYCSQTLGIPQDHIHLYEDATAGNIIACIENLKETARAYEGDANIIFYYAGHAFPDEKEHSAFLLPIDGNSQNIATAYSLKKLYSEFNSIPIKTLLCFIDACFSGTTRSDDMLVAGRGVAVKVKDDIPQGNAVVFTSATGAETAHSYEEKGHGLYTYFLLQKLQQSNGDVTMGELTEYVRKMVRRKSVLINEKLQTPTVIPSPSALDWQNWKLK